MNIDINTIEFTDWISGVLNLTSVENEGEWLFVNRKGDPLFSILNEKLEEEIDKLREYDETPGVGIVNSVSYEALLSINKNFISMRPSIEPQRYNLEDIDNKILYSVTKPSNTFCLYLLYRAALVGGPRDLLTMMVPYHFNKKFAEGERHCVFDGLRHRLKRLFTFNIESETKKNFKEFEKFGDSYLFGLSYNTDSSFVIQRNFEEILKSGRIRKVRNIRLEEVTPPCRFYVQDLVHHYQLAVATDNPMLEFISYYHVAEHYFENIFADDLIENVKLKITHPDFSYKRKKDINSLIKSITRSVSIRNENMIINELEALRLTLKKFIDLEELIGKINEYDSSLCEYFKNSKVDFADADIVDFMSSDADTIYKKLSKRIYKTRNSIVHSKESDKSRYVPFKDDQVLLKEVPLLRFIAEQIIIKNSTPM